MKKVYCLNNISKPGLEKLPSDYEVVSELDGSLAVFVRSAAMHEMELPSSVLAVARAGAGVNNIPLAAYAKKGVVVFNTPGANANAVKELSIAGMLLASRDINGGIEWVKANKADPDIAKSVEKAKKAFAGTEIAGKTIGIIGLGAIGSLIAEACGGLKMKVVGFEPSKAAIEKNGHRLPSDIKLVDTIDELYGLADFISINIPLLPATKGMINSSAFSKMKDGVILLNFSRDTIVNDVDLAKALESKKIRKYVTDFPNPAVVSLDNVIAISHLGASTEEAEDNCAMMAAMQVSDFIENGNIVNSVNYPSLVLGPKLEGRRIVVLYKAIEGIETKIQGMLCSAKKCVSGVKGEVGALIADVECCEECAAKLNDIEGVIKVRLI